MHQAQTQTHARRHTTLHMHLYSLRTSLCCYVQERLQALEREQQREEERKRRLEERERRKQEEEEQRRQRRMDAEKRAEGVLQCCICTVCVHACVHLYVCKESCVCLSVSAVKVNRHAAHLSINATYRPLRASSGIQKSAWFQAYKTNRFCMPDEARDGRNVALIDKCFMVCSIVQRRIKLLSVSVFDVCAHTFHLCIRTYMCVVCLSWFAQLKKKSRPSKEKKKTSTGQRLSLVSCLAQGRLLLELHRTWQKSSTQWRESAQWHESALWHDTVKYSFKTCILPTCSQ